MKIRKLFLFIVIATFSFVGNVFAYPVSEGDTIKFQNGVYGNTAGGEFKVVASDDPATVLFKTFCLEYSEHLNFTDNFYVYDISDTAFNGGFEGSAPSIDGDPISEATKWLYWNYVVDDYADGLEEKVAGYSSTSNLGINALQLAIWNLEDEITFNTYGYSIAGGGYVGISSSTIALAENLVSAANWGAGNDFVGDVAVMNIKFYDERGPLAQSQLIADTTPVPEPSTFLLFAAGGGLVFFARRKRK